MEGGGGRVYETAHVCNLSLGGTCFIVLFLMQLLLSHEPFSTTDLLLATVHQCILSEDKLCVIRGEQSMWVSYKILSWERGGGEGQ